MLPIPSSFQQANRRSRTGGHLKLLPSCSHGPIKILSPQHWPSTVDRNRTGPSWYHQPAQPPHLWFLETMRYFHTTTTILSIDFSMESIDQTLHWKDAEGPSNYHIKILENRILMTPLSLFSSKVLPQYMILCRITKPKQLTPLWQN